MWIHLVTTERLYGASAAAPPPETRLCENWDYTTNSSDTIKMEFFTDTINIKLG